MENSNYQTKTYSLELKLEFTTLVDANERELIWHRVEEAIVNELPLNTVSGYGEDFWIENIHLKK